ncbi:hypothetical protein MICAG_3230005 [Microcystis aeruginosa PCC 9808]|uniref:Uncharacterized protein n=1 Tax=Microcystis aeruginosa PCC 9808 TaxID=1160284 RepID=I4HXJ2_MICAE|nr:hypothetical protein MICAG_3230005 [Microcystis aeruginosa PCC 9808]
MSQRLPLPEIRRKKNSAFAAIYRVNFLAFGWENEANLGNPHNSPLR